MSTHERASRPHGQDRPAGAEAILEVPSATLRTVLGLEIFRRADAYVACGHERLDRLVRWVHASEISDIARFLSGGELLLTAGAGLGGTEEAQRSYVASLAHAGVAALAIELSGRFLEALPPAVVDAADQQGLVLVGLRHEIPFVEASAQVSQFLGDAAVREAQRTLDTIRDLTSRLAAGADHIELVRTIAKSVRRSIVLESADHELQASYAGEGEEEPALKNWAHHSRSLEDHRNAQLETGSCLRRPVLVQGATWGYLHMPRGSDASHVDKVILESGASAIAISLLNERVSEARGRHQQAILINRLEMGDINGPAFVERALRLGRDLRGTDLVTVAIDVLREGDGDLERAVATELRSARLTALTADVGNVVMSVVGVKSDAEVVRLLAAIGSVDRRIGVSKVLPSAELGLAIRQARAALMAGRPVQRFEELGLLKLLVPLSDGPELAMFVEEELGPVIAYDNKHGSDLLTTLSTYLRADGNKTTAAQELFIQRRTLYHRLDRIRRILGVDPEDVDVRTRLQVAVQAAGLLRNSRAMTHREPR